MPQVKGQEGTSISELVDEWSATPALVGFKAICVTGMCFHVDPTFPNEKT